MIEIVDTTTRDGNQSLWGATGLTTPDVLAIAPVMDRVGFRACDFTSSTHMAVSVRFHQEDPWERLRLVAEAMPNTPLSMITTGKRFISWRPCAEDVQALVFRCAVRNGLRRVQIADPMNDPDDLANMAAIAKREGVEEVVIGLTYSVSPVHTDAYYGERAAAIGRCEHVDRLYLKDPGGLVTVERLRELAPLFFTGPAGRAAQPRDDRARGPDVPGGREARLRHAPHGGRAGRQRHEQPRGGDDPAQPRGDRPRARARHRGAGRDVRALPGAGAREAAPARRARRLRRRLLPPPDARRHGHDDAPPAGGDAPPGAVRRRAGGDRPRPRGVRLADHGHAVLAVRRHAGGDERDGRRALREHPRRRDRLLPRPLRDAAGAARPGGRRPRAVPSARGRAARHGTADRRPRAVPRRVGRGAAAAADDAGRAGRRDRTPARRAPAARRSSACSRSWPSAPCRISGSRPART